VQELDRAVVGFAGEEARLHGDAAFLPDPAHAVLRAHQKEGDALDLLRQELAHLSRFDERDLFGC